MRTWYKIFKDKFFAGAAIKAIIVIMFALVTVFFFITYSRLGSLFSVPTPPFESLDPGIFERDPLNPKIYRSRKPRGIAVSPTNKIFISLQEEPFVQYYSTTG